MSAICLKPALSTSEYLKFPAFFFRYMKIFGLKFSKEDHIALVKLYYELVTIPHLEPNRLYKFSTTLLFLLK